MPRIPMVTRTIKTTHATVLCLDVERGEPFNCDIKLPRTFKNEEEMMKTIKKEVDTDTVKAVHVVASEIRETRYGMSEIEFIKYADVLPMLKQDKE